METAISIPDDLFASAELLATRTHQSRSQVYSAAVREYIARHAPEAITEQMDRVLADLHRDGDLDEFGRLAAARTMARVEW